MRLLKIFMISCLVFSLSHAHDDLEKDLEKQEIAGILHEEHQPVSTLPVCCSPDIAPHIACKLGLPVLYACVCCTFVGGVFYQLYGSPFN